MIAVVIPVHNQAVYLGEALDSVEAQTLRPEEVIVVDDGSTDGSGDLAAARGYDVLRTARRGPKLARMAGAEATKAGWIVFVDGDDRLRPRHHELLLGAARQEEVAGAYGMVGEFADPAADVVGRFDIRDEPRLVPLAGACLMRRELYFDAIEADPSPTGHDWFPVAERIKPLAQVHEQVLERRIHGLNRTIVERDAVQRAYLASARAAIVKARGGGR